jgi:hypothetical protein
MSIAEKTACVNSPAPQAEEDPQHGPRETPRSSTVQQRLERYRRLQRTRPADAQKPLAKAHSADGRDDHPTLIIHASPDRRNATNRPPRPGPNGERMAAPMDDEINWSVPSHISIRTVEDWLRSLVDPHGVVELRALGVDRDGSGRTHIEAGFYDYDHLRDMARAAMDLSDVSRGVYYTPNSLDPALLARINNTTKWAKGGDAASDKDVICRRKLLVDADPIRIAGIPSTDHEKAMAREVIKAVRSYLKERGWPDPVVGDSGNGYHLQFSIDQSPDDGGLIKNCLLALAARFDTADVQIDTRVFNPARICKLYATMVRKGDGTPDRPHRRSAILHIPAPLEVVPRELLEALAAEAPSETAKTAPTAEAGAVGSSVIDRAREHLAGMPPAIQGEDGSGKAFAAACALIIGFGLTVEQALPLYREYSSRCQPPWSEAELLHKLQDAARKAVEEPRRVGYLLKPGKGKGKAGSSGETDSKHLIQLGTQEATLFVTPEQKPFVALTVAGHRETHALGSKAYKRWLTGVFYDKTGRTPNPETFRAALAVLEHLALRGAVESVHIRTAEVTDPNDPHNPTYFLDLGNGVWQAVKISRDGWEVVDNPTVRFRRPNGMLPLPTPERGGNLDELRCYINIHDADWPLYRAALTSYVRPRGPFPIIILSGGMGSAKTTTCEVTRLMVDPHVSLLRSPPRDERDLLIAAINSGMVAIDNVSYLSDWLSDGLCRIASGGGLSTRALYTDDEEVHFNVQKPIVINGIEDVASRGDLLDRGLVFGLPDIADGRRRTESDFWSSFRDTYPRLLGALLDIVVGALAALPEVTLEQLPRMADFARWGEAVGQACGEEPGVFRTAYARNRSLACEIALESSLVASAIRTSIATRGRPWTGSATDLLEFLGEQIDVSTRRTSGWPKSPRSLAGALRRAVPGLRAAGIAVEFTRDAAARSITITPGRPPA